MRKSSSLSRFVLTGITLGIFLFAVSTTLSQSGRRGSKPTPAPTATPEPTPVATPQEKEEKATTTFIVGVNKFWAWALRTASPRLISSRTISIFTRRPQETEREASKPRNLNF